VVLLPSNMTVAAVAFSSVKVRAALTKWLQRRPVLPRWILTAR